MKQFDRIRRIHRRDQFVFGSGKRIAKAVKDQLFIVNNQQFCHTLLAMIGRSERIDMRARMVSLPSMSGIIMSTPISAGLKSMTDLRWLVKKTLRIL